MAIDLSSIKTGVRIKPPKVVVYGVGGIGKTTFAAGAPNPVFLFTEEGQGLLDVPRFEPEENDPVIRTWQQLIEACRVLHGDEHSFGTVVLDTLDFAEPLLWRYTAGRYAKDDIEAFGYGKGYGYAVDEARVLFDWFDALRRDRQMAVVILAHSKVRRFESPDAESYDRYQLDVHERLASHVHSWCDALMFANYKAHVVKDKEEFNKERRRATGTGERVLYAEERPSYWAKNRYGLPPELPLQWSAFQNAIAVPVSQQPATAESKS